MAIQHISHVSIYVKDQDEALDWYTNKLGFKVCDDNSDLVPGFRWLTVSPQDDNSTQIVLMPTREPGDEEKIGKNPVWVLTTDNCRADCDAFAEKGIAVIDPPNDLPWGVSALITDLYGNVFNLVEPKPMPEQ